MAIITANKIVKKAVKEIGVKEKPANSNKVKYNTWYYGKEVSGSAYPWCCAFISWLFYKTGAANLLCNGQKVAYCPNVESYYKKINRWYPNTKGKKGDLCLMDFGKGRASHIGIVEKKNSNGTYTVIEGNTSISSNDNGGSVMRRVRSRSVIRGFARPKYKTVTTSSAVKNKDTDETKYPKYKVNTFSGLIIREKAKKSSGRIGKYVNHTVVEIIKYNMAKTWGKTNKGWICLKYTEQL